MKQDLPLISVIVPIYNTAKYLDRCLKSIVCQSYKNLEIILINDGSTDGSGEICEKWGEKDNRIRVFHKKNEGLVNARKEGVALSNGEYIAQVDSDDWIESEMYNEMMEFGLSSDADIITSGLIRDYNNYSIIEEEGFPRGIYKGKTLKKQYWANVIATDKFFKTNVNAHITNKLFKRKLALKHQMVLCEKIRIGDDAAVIYPAIFDANCIAVVGKCYYHYIIYAANSVMSVAESENIGSEYIESRFKEIVSEKKDIVPEIKEQLRRVMLYNRFFIEPEKVFEVHDKSIYPFSNLNSSDKIIIYGAGRFGKRVFQYFQSNGLCDVIAWCDRVSNDSIIAVDEALQYKFDKIVIAVLIADIADEIELSLLERKIDKDIICRINI